MKILFENTGDMPIDVEFQVDKSSPELNIGLMRNGRLSVDSNGKNILEGKMLYQPKEKEDNASPKTIHKLLIGKIKECEL